ncbi:MAG: hypothetical protein JOZ70_03735 [Pseudolabrys sp.]|nr:hypothetical protein [Pseudolabrys sp.]MBV9954342.1 hypothetical protein [Pseudolabrys sp.]
MTEQALDLDGNTYAYQPSAFGAAWIFRLTPSGLAWENRTRSGLVPLRDISKVRMSYRPATMQNNRFVTRLWHAGGPPLTIISTSWKGLMRQEANSASYSAFVRELHSRIAGATAQTTYEAGIHPLVYGFGVLFGGACVLAIIGLELRAAASGAWSAAAVLFGFLVFFLWSGVAFFRRNRPHRYRPDDPPRLLLPES